MREQRWDEYPTKFGIVGQTETPLSHPSGEGNGVYAAMLVRRRLRCCQPQQGRVGRVPAAYAGSPATAMGGGRVAWDIGNDRT